MSNLMIEFADQKFHLLPSGGIFWQDEEILILADLHLEKGSGFREQNNFLPPYDTLETLSLLQETIKNLSPKKVLLLGDSMHDSQSFHRMPLHLKKYLEAIMVESDLVWIRGNHDATIRGFPSALSPRTHTRRSIFFAWTRSTSLSRSPPLAAPRPLSPRSPRRRPRPQPAGQQPRGCARRVLRRSHCVRTHRLAATALSYPECDEAREDERGQSIGRRGRVAKTILWHGALSISSSSLVIAEPALGNVH